jgi:hypothetical protein
MDSSVRSFEGWPQVITRHAGPWWIIAAGWSRFQMVRVISRRPSGWRSQTVKEEPLRATGAVRYLLDWETEKRPGPQPVLTMRRDDTGAWSAPGLDQRVHHPEGGRERGVDVVRAVDEQELAPEVPGLGGVQPGGVTLFVVLGQVHVRLVDLRGLGQLARRLGDRHGEGVRGGQDPPERKVSSPRNPVDADA